LSLINYPIIVYNHFAFNKAHALLLSTTGSITATTCYDRLFLGL